MTKNNTQLQEYDITLKHAEFASEQLWKIFEIFILTNTIFIALVGSILFKKDISTFNKQAVLLMGLVMSFLWLGAYFRTRGYYNFRLAQAEEKESDNLKLLKDRGAKFAEGERVQIGKKYFRMNFLARLLRMSYTMPAFIGIFFTFYLFLFFQNSKFSLDVQYLSYLVFWLFLICQTSAGLETK